jgi:hypothetical protein
MVGTKHGVALSGGGLQEKWSDAQDLAKTNHNAGKTSLNLLSTAFTFKDRDISLQEHNSWKRKCPLYFNELRRQSHHH